MAIRFLTVRPSGTIEKLSKYAATTITAILYRKSDLGELDITAKDLLGIFMEQAILADYLLSMNPNNTVLQSYRDRITSSFKHFRNTDYFSEKALRNEQIHETDVNLIYSFVCEKQSINGSVLESILDAYTSCKSGSKYTTVPKEFAYPYLQFKAGYIPDTHADENGNYINPAVLSPVYRTDKENGDVEVTFYCRPYTTMTLKNRNVFQNKTLGYICAMNHNGKSWKELVDAIQSLHMHEGSNYGLESLSNVLNNYVRGKSYSQTLPIEPLKQDLLLAIRTVAERDAMVFNKDVHEVKELDNLFSYLKDNRLAYLLLTDPSVGDKTLWESQMDLQFLNDLSLAGYVMAAEDEDSDAADDAGGEDDFADDASEDDTTADDAEDEGGEEDEDDPFGDDDDFADDDGEGDGDDSGDSGSSGGTGDGGSGSSSSTTDTPTDENSEAENVNPVIELIEDETFDEYLDRGILQIRIKRLIASPPFSMSAGDLAFLKYWYIQWFPCVSVATTREILGDILLVPSKRLH